MNRLISGNASAGDRLDQLTRYRISGPQATAWRIIPEIDKNPRVIKFVESIAGKMLLFIVFGILVFLAAPHHHGEYRAALECLLNERMIKCLGIDPAQIAATFVITLLAATCAFAEKYRWWAVPFATAIILYQNSFWFNAHLAVTVATKEGVEGQINFTALGLCTPVAVFLFSAFVIYSARLFRGVFVFRRPILCMIVFLFSMVVVAASPALHGVQRVLLWSFIGTFVVYFWFLGYALLEIASRTPPILAQLGTFYPFWISGATSTPFGKSVTYLQRFESHGSRELAVTQLKGLKLLLWVLILKVAGICFIVVTERYFHIPNFDEAFAAQVAGAPYPWYVGWGSLVVSFVENLFGMVMFGGPFIAVARMAGFRLLRNTYRPLESRTIADFWTAIIFIIKSCSLISFFTRPSFGASANISGYGYSSQHSWQPALAI
ncbi:MAG: hypothetical protein WA728_28875 [Xanthobacteraceae bacterium]